MTSKINENADKKFNLFLKGAEAYHKELEAKKYTGQQLEADLKDWRSTERPSNWFTWRYIHKKRGVYASFKDDGFLKFCLKEVNKKRTMPFFLAGMSWYIFIQILAKPPAEEMVNSPNFYPYGVPNGSKLNPHLEHLLHEDLDGPGHH